MTICVVRSALHSSAARRVCAISWSESLRPGISLSTRRQMRWVLSSMEPNLDLEGKRIEFGQVISQRLFQVLADEDTLRPQSERG